MLKFKELMSQKDENVFVNSDQRSKNIENSILSMMKRFEPNIKH